MIAAIVSLISVPIALLNFFSGIVGGIWLATLGKWSLLGLALLVVFISSTNIALALLPGLLFAAPGAVAMERGKYLIGTSCLLISNLWTYVVMAVWCIGCFNVVIDFHNEGSIWPYLLWAYSMATGPWTYMASRSAPDDYGSTIGALAACIGSISIMGDFLFTGAPTVIDTSIAFCVPFSIVFIIQAGLAVALTKERMQGRKENTALE